MVKTASLAGAAIHMILLTMTWGSAYPVIAQSTSALSLESLPESPAPSTPGSPGSPLQPPPQSQAPRRAPYLFPISARPAPQPETFHWKGLILQSLAFVGIENGVRIATASGSDREILINKPFWHDYVASLKHYNMRRWNDGDSFAVNYVGHPLQGAISGYIEVQNSPNDRKVRFSASRAYWKSRSRAFLWSAAYSTGWEVLPIGEAGIFNTGGYTYPIRCSGAECKSPNATYTNNTGWVDFVITPVLGTALLVAGDFADKFTDRGVEAHPHAVKYKIIRGVANPTRSFANLLRGRYPWYRDYESPTEWESTLGRRFATALTLEPKEHGDVFVHYSLLNVRTNYAGCAGCRTAAAGVGVETGIRVAPYLDVVVDISHFNSPSPLPSPNIGGNLILGNVGLRSGFNGKRIALKFVAAPGVASYAKALPVRAEGVAPTPTRVNNFQALAALSLELKPNPWLSFRVTAENRLIRYKRPEQDPPGIGTPPNLTFLSHEYFVNSTNWGMRMGPVLRF